MLPGREHKKSLSQPYAIGNDRYRTMHENGFRRQDPDAAGQFRELIEAYAPNSVRSVRQRTQSTLVRSQRASPRAGADGP
jgi:hypothetical protein